MSNHFNPVACVRMSIAVCLTVVTGALGAAAQEGTERSVPETFTATTANMDPEGTDLRINVLRWSGDEDRQAVLAVLTDPENAASADGDLDALIELPTVGYVWPDGSALGYSIKYAHRATTADGGEHLTFVTGRRLGKFAREPWAPEGTPEEELRPFSVIELRLDADGNGAGTMSPAAEAVFDAANHTAALVNYDDAPTLFEGAKRQPPPYWAQ